ncbi:MAG: hypothetical protein ACLT5P_07355 [Flavonifractor plautii]
MSLLDTMMMVSFFVVLVGIVGLLADSLLLVNVLSVLCVAGLLIIGWGAETALKGIAP